MQLLYRNVQRFRGGLVFKAHRLLYQSTLGLRDIMKKKTCKVRHGREDGRVVVSLVSISGWCTALMISSDRCDKQKHRKKRQTQTQEQRVTAQLAWQVWDLTPLLFRSKPEEMEALKVGEAMYLLMMHEADEAWGCHALLSASLQHFAPVRSATYAQVFQRVVHLGRSTCHAISGRGDQSTRLPFHITATMLPHHTSPAVSCW